MKLNSLIISLLFVILYGFNVYLFTIHYAVRKELELALESCHEVVDKYKIDTEVARIKVKEAIEVVEKTYSEKDRLVKDLNISNGKYNF